MTISETIAYLEKLKEQRGDIHIEFGNDTTDEVMTVEELLNLSDGEDVLTLGVIV